MKTIRQKIHLLIFLIFCSFSTTVAQVISKDSVISDTTKIPKPIKVNPPVQSSTSSWDEAFHKGSLIVGAGIVYEKNVLPVMLVGEYGLGRNIGVEVRTWYGGNTVDGVKYQDGLIGVGLNYHFTGDIKNSSDRFDAYVGGLYGKVIEDTGSAFYGQGGARYLLFRRFGIFGNFNIGLIGIRGTNLSFGLAYSIF
jgi:hypothetical protein